VVLGPPPPDDLRGARSALIYYQKVAPPSDAARRRLELFLERERDRLVAERFAERGAPLDPGKELPVVARDLSRADERSGAALGRFLPFILLALLLTGGAFAAIDVIAGEKERGTLETLFTQPIDGAGVILGKFLAVLAASLAAVVLNLAGMGAAIALGFGPAGPGPGLEALPPPWVLLTILLLVAPLAVLTSAVLLAVSAFARSYREAQMYLLPLTLAALLPALLAAAPDIRLSAAVAVIPVANTALGIREALLGEFRPAFLATAFATTALYAALALRWAARLLAREDLRLGIEPEPLLGAVTGAARSRRGIAFGILMLVLVAALGSAAQHPEGAFGPVKGLLVTLWAIVLLPALAYVAAFRLPVRQVLALRRPRARDLAGAAALVPAAVVLISAYMSFQDTVLPYSEGLAREMAKIYSGSELSLAGALFLIAVSPAICEEVLWRGVVQGEVEAEDRPLKTVLVIGIFFGVFHLDAFRLVPTAALGALLAWLRLRSGSIFPSMLFHALFNGTMLLGARLGGEEFSAWLLRPAVVVAAATAAPAIIWLVLPRRSPAKPSVPAAR
jgi:sodium transport system permease protein